MEARALSSLFDERMKTSSIKANIGHTLGAASAIEAIVCTKILETGILPPTLNLQQRDPECKVDVIAIEPRFEPVDYVLSNAYAFGGINSSILMGRA
jgi:3-oxoacyl-[acyl-carrier-protein] synthase II